MVDFIIFLIYRFLLIPLALFILAVVRPFARGKLRTLLDERRSPQRPALVARPIWIHASSGEIEYAKPLVQNLRERYPEIPILITYFSPSAHRLKKGLEGVDAFLPIPFDSIGAVRRFIDYANPTCVLFSRTDVWPELAYQLRMRSIPTYLFSATLARNSSRIRGAGRFLNRFAFNQLTEIFCVNEADRAEFENLGVAIPIKPLGDSRYDQVQNRLQAPRQIKNIQFPQQRGGIFTIGSSWPQDELPLLQALEHILPKLSGVIWAPHEVTDKHLRDLEIQFQKHNWSFIRYSELQENTQTDDSRKNNELQIILVDQIGILQELYLLADFAFVGGSFKDRVHSVMEPLAAGLPVLVGPYHENNREALHFALRTIPESANLRFVNSVLNANEISNTLEKLMDLKIKIDFKTAIREEIRKQAGVTDRILNETLNNPNSLLTLIK